MLLVLLLLAVLGVWSAAQLGTGWQATKRREAYLPQLEKAAEENPYDASLLALLGGRLIEAGELTQATEVLRRAAALDNTPVVWLNLAAAQAAQGNVALAQADIRLGLEKNPGSPLLQAALTRFRTLGKGASPEAVAQALCPNGPSELIAAYAKGSFLNGVAQWQGKRNPEESGFATRAEVALQQPDNPEAQRLWGLALLKNRRYAEAIPVLEQAVARAPQSLEANLALADAQVQVGLYAKAMPRYLAVLQRRKDFLPALIGFGQAAAGADAAKYALGAFRRATQIAPKSVDAWIGLGRISLTFPALRQQAREAFETAATLAPDRTDFFSDYAVTLRQESRMNANASEQRTKALSLLQRRLTAVPDDAIAHYLMGNLLLSGATPDERDKAEAETRLALKLRPGDALSEIQLAKILLEKGSTGEAANLLAETVRRDPQNATALALLARCYQRLGKPEQAETVAAKARQMNKQSDRIRAAQEKIQKSPMDAEGHEQLAALYQQAGADDKARREADMATLIRANPEQAKKQTAALAASVQQVLE